MTSTRAQAFADIYRTNAWNGRPGLGAGPGSTPEAAAWAAAVLPDWCEKFEVVRLLDAGCGDGTWMPPLPCAYIGVDIVEDVIARRAAADPERSFLLLDFVEDPLPPSDAVLCRDAFQHLSWADIFLALENFGRAGARVLFANSHRGQENVEIESGGWFAIDLEAGPFFLGPPEVETPDGFWAEGERWPGKFLGAWRL